MKYVVIVSHGMLAPGLHDAVKMLAGEDSPEVLSTSLLNGMGADEYADNFRKLISVVGPEDEIILFADLVGGSPLSFAANVLAEEGLLGAVEAAVVLFELFSYSGSVHDSAVGLL